jgi:hypothetical protein
MPSEDGSGHGRRGAGDLVVPLPDLIDRRHQVDSRRTTDCPDLCDLAPQSPVLSGGLLMHTRLSLEWRKVCNAARTVAVTLTIPVSIWIQTTAGLVSVAKTLVLTSAVRITVGTPSHLDCRV